MFVSAALRFTNFPVWTVEVPRPSEPPSPLYAAWLARRHPQPATVLSIADFIARRRQASNPGVGGEKPKDS